MTFALSECAHSACACMALAREPTFTCFASACMASARKPSRPHQAAAAPSGHSHGRHALRIGGAQRKLMVSARTDCARSDGALCAVCAGDIQLTLCQSVQFDAAVIVTTPQKLAFIDVAKGIRMFAKMAVPCVAVAENMSFFDADGKRFHPFGQVRLPSARRSACACLCTGSHCFA
jgi:hypothetical protein